MIFIIITAIIFSYIILSSVLYHEHGNLDQCSHRWEGGNDDSDDLGVFISEVLRSPHQGGCEEGALRKRHNKEQHSDPPKVTWKPGLWASDLGLRSGSAAHL